MPIPDEITVQYRKFRGNVFAIGTTDEWDAFTSYIPGLHRFIITADGDMKLGNGLNPFHELPFIYKASMYQQVIDNTADIDALKILTAAHQQALLDHEARLRVLKAASTDYLRRIVALETLTLNHTGRLNAIDISITSLNQVTLTHTNQISTLQGSLSTLTLDYNTHKASRNPHGTTAGDVGAPTIEQYNALVSQVNTLTTLVDELRNVGRIAITTNTTLAAIHRGRYLDVTADGLTITIPTNATTALPVGTTITVALYVDGMMTISPATGVTLRWTGVSGTDGLGVRTVSEFGMVTLYKRAVNVWTASGTNVE